MARDLHGQRRYDLLVGGLFATTRRVEEMRFTDPYLDLHFSLIVADCRKNEFTSLENLRRMSGVRIGVLERPYFGTRIQQAAPNAEVVLLESPRPFFEDKQHLDALVMSAEAGSAWTLLYPSYAVVTPNDAQLTVSVGYPLPLDGDRLETVVSRWIDLKRKDGTIASLYEHWIEGKTAEETGPRWNILTNVFGWGQDGVADESFQARQVLGSRSRTAR